MSAPSPEQQWARTYAEAESERRDEPAWLAAQRKAAMGRFAELGFPTRRREDWKYTNVSPVVRVDYARAASPTRLPDTADLEAAFPPLRGARRLVFVNGRPAPELSATDGLEARVVVAPLSRVLDEDAARLEPHLGRVADATDRAFVALNTALHEDGAAVLLPEGTSLATPLHLVFVSVVGETPIAIHPRVLVVADREARATIVEVHLGFGEGVRLSNAVTEVRVGEAARVDHVRVQAEPAGAFHLGMLQACVGRDARLTSHALSFGAALARTEIEADLDAEGAECTLNGLYVGQGTQHVDHQTVIEHRAPHGSSHELYKGILAGRARGVFNGRIVVHPGADGTDAQQRNENLLLELGAEIDTRPVLEIHADDVKCSHGSAIGHLDEDALFYLRARGIDAEEGRAMLTRGFAAGVTAELPEETLRSYVEEQVVAELFRAAAEARP